MGRPAKAHLLVILCIILAATLSACGDEETDTSTDDQAGDTQTAPDDREPSPSDPFDAVAELEATVTVTVNGQTTVIWSQKDENWRWQDPDNQESYVIYNAEEGKLWVVDDKVAQESDQAGENSIYWAQSPAGMLGMFTIVPGGIYEGDTYTHDVDNDGNVDVVIEFKGPEGLPSSFISYAPDGSEEDSITFEYTDVGNVSDDLFVLPADVTIQAMPDLPEIPELPEM